MKVDIYWINIPGDGKLGIIPRPRGGDWLEDEIISLKESSVDTLVSLLEIEEVEELDLKEEEAICHDKGIKFISLPIKDRDVPSSVSRTIALCNDLKIEIEQRRSILIHCRQGIGRSSLIASSIMVLMDFDSERAFTLIEKARGCAVPDTREQREWVKRNIENKTTN
jgi:protein-tyrosine phosphatase